MFNRGAYNRQPYNRHLPREGTRVPTSYTEMFVGRVVLSGKLSFCVTSFISPTAANVRRAGLGTRVPESFSLALDTQATRIGAGERFGQSFADVIISGASRYGTGLRVAEDYFEPLVAAVLRIGVHYRAVAGWVDVLNGHAGWWTALKVTVAHEERVPAICAEERLVVVEVEQQWFL